MKLLYFNLKIYKNNLITILLILFVFGCIKKDANLINKSIITCSSQYKGFLASYLVDNDTNTYWLSGMTGQQFLNFYLDKPCNINHVKFVIEVSPSSNTQVQLFYKQKGSGDSLLITKNIVYIKKNKEYDFKMDLKDVYSFSLIMKNDSSWVAIKKIEIIGQTINDIYPW